MQIETCVFKKNSLPFPLLIGQSCQSISSATKVAIVLNSGEPRDKQISVPTTAWSRLKYAIAICSTVARYSWWYSTVPIRPSNDAGQIGKTIVRLLLHPPFFISKIDLMSSFWITKPVLASLTPCAKASICEPTRIMFSWTVLPKKKHAGVWISAKSVFVFTLIVIVFPLTRSKSAIDSGIIGILGIFPSFSITSKKIYWKVELPLTLQQSFWYYWHYSRGSPRLLKYRHLNNELNRTECHFHPNLQRSSSQEQ